MSKNITIKSATALAAVATLSVRTAVNADEITVAPQPATSETTTTQESVNPIEQAQTNVDTTAKTLDEVTVAAQPALQAEEVAQAEYDEAKSSLETATTNSSEATQAVTDTQNEIDSREANIPTLGQNVSDLESEVVVAQNQEQAAKDALTQAEEVVETEESKIQPQVDDLNAKTSTYEDAQATHQTAEQNLANAETALDNANKTVTTLKNKLDSAEATQLKEQQDLAAAQAADVTRQSNIDSAQTEVDNLTAENAALVNAVAQATSNVTTTQANLDTAKANVVKNFDVTLTEEFITAFNNYNNNINSETVAALKLAGDNWMKQNPESEVFKLLKEGDTRPADIANLTDEQYKELTIFAAQLVEDIRVQMNTYGDNQLKVSEETIKLSQLVSQVYKDEIAKTTTETPGMWDAYEVGHLNSEQTIKANLVESGVVVDPNGPYPDSSRFENLAYTTTTYMNNNELNGTMGGLKGLVYKKIMDLLVNDAGSGFAHAAVIARNMGIEEERKDQARTQFMLLIVQDGTYVTIGTQETNFDWDKFNNTSDMTNLSLTNIEVPKTDSVEAKALLAKATTDAQTAKTELATLQAELKEVAPELAAAQDKLTEAINVAIQTPTAQAELDKSTQAVTEAQTNLDNVKAKLPALETNVSNARTALATATNDLNAARTAYNTSKANYDKVAGDYEVALAKAKELQKAYEEKVLTTKNTKEELESAKQAIIDNQKEIARLKALLPELEEKAQLALEELEAAKTTFAEAESKLSEAKVLADSERAKIAEAKDAHQAAVDYLNSLKAEEVRKQEQIKQQEEAQRIIEETQKRLAEQEVANVNAPNGLTSATSSDSLPKTGEANSSFALMGFIMSIMASLLFFKKKEN